MGERSVREDPVVFRHVETASGHVLAVARLNTPKSLNALSLEMIRLLDRQLRRWSEDPRVACVILRGTGEKAFCAGGDVRSLRSAIVEQGTTVPNPIALQFFGEEYRLDYRIHTYPKPVLAFGSGIVMGGGVGLLAGASHRVVTETSRIAMPEISIGLFPDVGGSWFLRRMPGHQGLFVALTGVALNAHDAQAAGLADYFLMSADREALFTQMTIAGWQDDAGYNRQVLTDILREFSARAAGLLPASNLLRHAEIIESLCDGEALSEIVERIGSYAGDDEWLQRGARTLKSGSPTTAALIWELRRRAAGLELADVFRLELVVALQCCAHPDFSEGVRALLIDKDHAPRWTPDHLNKVTSAWIDRHFAPPAWPNGIHPLIDL